MSDEIILHNNDSLISQASEHKYTENTEKVVIFDKPRLLTPALQRTSANIRMNSIWSATGFHDEDVYSCR